MGFARQVVKKSVRKATPRGVRKATHPVRTVTNAVTPRPVKKATRAVYTVTNPIGAAVRAPTVSTSSSIAPPAFPRSARLYFSVAVTRSNETRVDEDTGNPTMLKISDGVRAGTKG